VRARVDDTQAEAIAALGLVEAVNTFRVSAGRFALLHVLSRSQIQVKPFHVAGSIPGSSRIR